MAAFVAVYLLVGAALVACRRERIDHAAEATLAAFPGRSRAWVYAGIAGVLVWWVVTLPLRAALELAVSLLVALRII